MAWADRRWPAIHMFYFTNSSPITFVSIPTLQPADLNLRPNLLQRAPQMNPANLPFDSEAMLRGLPVWVECEIPPWDAAAADRMLDIASRHMAIMGASIERIAGRQGFGG